MGAHERGTWKTQCVVWQAYVFFFRSPLISGSVCRDGDWYRRTAYPLSHSPVQGVSYDWELFGRIQGEAVLKCPATYSDTADTGWNLFLLFSSNVFYGINQFHISRWQWIWFSSAVQYTVYLPDPRWFSVDQWLTLYKVYAGQWKSLQTTVRTTKSTLYVTILN